MRASGTRWLIALALSASVGAMAVAGCGGSKDKPDPKAGESTAIRTVLHELQKASIAGDGALICNEVFTPKLANSVTRSAKSGSCAKEVRKNLFSPSTRLTVQAVSVADAANGTATVKEANGNTSTVFFVRQSGRWRIRGIQPA